MIPAGPREITRRAAPGLIVLLGGVLLAGCSAATSSGSPAAPASAPPSTAPSVASAEASMAPSESVAPSAAEPSASSGATAVPTSIDPCQVVTSQEASALAGASFGAGKKATTENNVNECVYTVAGQNIFTVQVAQAPDVATAQAAKAAVEAQIQSVANKGLDVTQLPDLADGGVVAQGSATISGQTFNVSSLALLKGTTYLGFSDLVLNHPAPTNAALEAQAQVSLGRLP